MAKPKGGKGVGWLAVIILFLIGVAIAVWLGTGETDSTPPAPPPTTEPEAPVEADLPGEAFEASGTVVGPPGAPNLPVNLWDYPDRSSGVIRVVGQLSPGDTVAVTRRYRQVEEDQFYYRVESGELVGWLPETLVDIQQ